MAKPSDPDVISAADVAALIGMGIRQVREGAARGEIPCKRIGRRLLFSRRLIDVWLHAPPSALAS